MCTNIVEWLYTSEEFWCERGRTRTGLAFGFVGDLVAGEVPLVLRVRLGWEGQ